MADRDGAGVETRRVRVAYADPPYPGCAHLYKEHPDYAGEVDHYQLARDLHDYDGWILHTASTTLGQVLDALYDAQWVKPFAAFKRNVSVAYAWEPVLVKPCRKPVVTPAMVMRDWISEPITLKRGLTGAKPEAVCRWAFHVLGMEPDDELVDLFPGSGAVTRAWESWQAERQLDFGGAA
jgi:hypothetical protein